MANPTKEQQEAEAQRLRDEAEAKAREAKAAIPSGGFVKMAKIGHDVIEVHPSCVNSHVAAGWAPVK